MEGAIITTNRVSFVDIDQSYSTPVADTNEVGFMVVRAPKGNTEGLYFAKGQSQLIHSMLGIPTADWPDIQDAIDYNNQYGIWISSPPGSSTEYPSTFGGSYLTKFGLVPFYQVTDIDALNYLTVINVGSEHIEFSNNFTSSTITINPRDPANAATHDSITISGINSSFLPYINALLFKSWGNLGQATGDDLLWAGAKNYELYADGSSLMQVHPDGVTPAVRIGTLTSATQWDLGGYITTKTLFNYMDFNQLVPIAPYLTGGGDAWGANPGQGQTAYKTAVLAALAGDLQWVTNVDGVAYLALGQKSPTEKPTKLTITNVGYEPNYFDVSTSIYTFTGGTSSMTWEAVTIWPTAEQCKNANRVYAVRQTNNAGAERGVKLYQASGTSTVTNVTKKYRSKYIKIDYAPTDPVSPTHADGSSLVGKIYYVTAADTLVECTVNGAYPYKADPLYNTVSFNVTEEVYPGKWVSGGSFVASLDPAGVDTYGGKNYIKEVLPDNADTFIFGEAKKTFAVDVVSGSYTGVKIVDSKARIYNTPTSVLSTLQGTRFMTSCVTALIASGATGGVINEVVAPGVVALLQEGWTEAAKSVYDPVAVFMEVTGEEILKENIYALRANTQKLSTFISPRILDADEANDLSTVAVTGRITGTAQYVNQFLRKDAYTGKKYWSNLMGAVGAKLTRIITDKLGGWAPMFTDIGGLGGQLAISVEKAKYTFTPDDLSDLDAMGLNPIIFDPASGLMITSQKTTQDPTNNTDWSYLGHSMAFDKFKREMRDGVMIPQIGKPNDTFFQDLRQRQSESIMNRRIGGLSPIWAAGKIEIANVNTADIKAQRGFKIKASVKVNIFSEWVQLEFVTVAQTVTL